MAKLILDGAPDAPQAAMTLLDHCQPPTLEAAVALLATQGTVTVAAFDRVGDAWDTYHHLMELS